MSHFIDEELSTIRLRQNALSLVLIALALGLVCLIIPPVHYQPHGISYTFPGKTSGKNTLADQVSLYKTQPYGSSVIGRVSVEMVKDIEDAPFQDRMFDYARAQAAQLGGTGVVVRGFGAQNNIAVLEADIVID